MNLVSKILTYLLVINTVASTLAVPLIYMDYSVRKDYIASVLCVNKDKPVLKCDGKCFLAKKIKAAQEQQEEGDEINFKNTVSFFVYQTVPETRVSSYRYLNKLYGSISDGQTSHGLLMSVDRPPRA